VSLILTGPGGPTMANDIPFVIVNIFNGFVLCESFDNRRPHTWKDPADPDALRLEFHDRDKAETYIARYGDISNDAIITTAKDDERGDA